MEKLQQQLMQLVLAAIQGDQKAQSTILLIMTAAQQPGADQQTVQIAQFIASLLLPESAKKGTKMKKKPLIPIKKCGNKVKKGELGLSSNRCKCMLKRVGGTIIEVDSCTGLPYRKSGGKVRKGYNGMEAWYNTDTADKMGIAGVEGAKHIFKSGDNWFSQTWNNNSGKWNNAIMMNTPVTEDDYQYAYAKGYNPTTGLFDNLKNYNTAVSNLKIKAGKLSTMDSGYGATRTINPYVKVESGPITEEGYAVTNADYNKRFAKQALRSTKRIWRDGLRKAGYSGKEFRDKAKELGVGLFQTIKLRDGENLPLFQQKVNNAFSAIDKAKQYKSKIFDQSISSNLANQTVNTGSALPLQSGPNNNSEYKFKQGGQLKIKLK